MCKNKNNGIYGLIKYQTIKWKAWKKGDKKREVY